MSIRFFEGPAGSGKTTRLMEELGLVIGSLPLGKDERVLAITKMHGSRRRLQRRLASVPGLCQRFECVTVDSFAWRLLRRWRSVAHARFGADPAARDHSEVCRRAGELLADRRVAQWVTRTFPVVVVDEMQDSKEGQLAIVQGMAAFATCLAAADGFQDLDADVQNAAVTWARASAEVIALTQVRRTSMAGLLAAAQALCDGHAVPSNGGGFTVLGAPNHNVGAKFVSQRLTWWGSCNDIAVITPVRRSNAPFVRDLIGRVEGGPIGKEKPVGPHKVPWEVSQEDEQGEFLSQLGLPSDPAEQVLATDISLPADTGPSMALAGWFDRQRRVAGRATFPAFEVREQVWLIFQRSRAFRRTRSGGVRAMTVHQAKNREFDSVIVLWPYQVQGSSERQRRLLYNAVTRAKRQVLVVVQNPDRLKSPPFAPGT